MYDNGLLKYYPTLSTEDGCLKIEKLTRLWNFEDADIKKVNVREGFFSGLTYYVKFNRERGIDAEVLLSQISTKLGFDSAIYLPCVDNKNNYGVVSNNVCELGTMTMKQYSKYMKFLNPSFKSPYRNKGLDIDKIELDKYFSKDAIKDYISMHYFDAFTSNVDRHDENFYIDTKLDVPNKLLKVENIKLIDYGISKLYLGLPDRYGYINGLGGEESLYASQMLEKLKTDDYVLQYVKPEEIAEKYGSFDVQDVADDIENTTGYQISKNYTIGLQDRFYSLAEELVK